MVSTRGFWGGLKAVSAAVALVIGQSTGQSTTLNAVADGNVNSNSPNSSFGAGITLSVGSISQQPALVQFDLTGFAGQSVTLPSRKRRDETLKEGFTTGQDNPTTAGCVCTDLTC